MTGIYFRIQRDGKWKSVDIVDMTSDEIESILQHKNSDYIIQLVIQLRDCLNRFRHLVDYQEGDIL